jgi:hypothetical protein
MTDEEKKELLVGEGEDEHDSIEKSNNINKQNINLKKFKNEKVP